MARNESHAHTHADDYVVDIALQEVRRQPESGLLIQFDDDDDVGLLAFYPGLAVDGERVNASSPGHHSWLTPTTSASRTIAGRRMHIVAAVDAALDPQPAVFAAGPEESGVGVIGGNQPVQEWILVEGPWRYVPAR